MTTLEPRSPYSERELETLYPQDLELRQAQVIFRHGERTPTSARFRNVGLAAYWPYCSAADQFRSAVRNKDETWDTEIWRRQIQSFGENDIAKVMTGANGVLSGICQPGELTDRGRETTLALGERLRHLYVDQLGFLPTSTSGEKMHLRSSPIPRALESLQQVYRGLYPPSSRTTNFAIPAIITRSFRDETIFPNESACKRLNELYKAFSLRAAQKYNDSPEMDAINDQLRNYMDHDEHGTPPRIAVDSRPVLNGIMDTINSTLAHGPLTKLPAAFYDPTTLRRMEKICVEQWFSGYRESNEYRTLGIGSFLGDVLQYMVENIRGENASVVKEQPAEGARFKLGLSGCHDTSLASMLISLGAFDPRTDRWPPYTSSIVFELFKLKANPSPSTSMNAVGLRSGRTWWSSLFGRSTDAPRSSARALLKDMSEVERAGLDDYFVRVKYNDETLVLPHCKAAGNHRAQHEDLCTLRAFKEIVDSITPRDWKAACMQNLGKPTIQAIPELPLGVGDDK